MNPLPNELFAPTPAVGLLKGFSPLPHQLEVDVIVPHQERGLPGFGEFLLVELNASEALVGRVSRYHAAGQLLSESGDAYLADLAKTEDIVPAPLMRQILRYTLKMQLLGHLRLDPATDDFKFSVGQRSFASLGTNVRLPSDAALAFLCNVGLEDDPTAAPLGCLAYGQKTLETVPVQFSVARLKGKRSFVFARAGYGKSNLIKYLVSQFYTSPPDVGLLIFDPEGEYALPDAHGRPGLVNVPLLRPRLSLYTNRPVSAEHNCIQRGAVHIDFGDFPPQDIVAAFVPREKQDTVFTSLLNSMEWDHWRELVKLLAAEGFATEDRKIAPLLAYRAKKEDVSLAAIRNNLVPVIRRLHRAGAPLGKNIIEELKQNRVVVVDISLLGTDDGQAITGLLLRRIFYHNVRHLTDISGVPLRCLAVLEEAQTVLGDRHLEDRDIFVRWVKEGRKYGLGIILVTQQPGSLAPQIISQGDNFFVLHLLNDGDLQTLQRHNAYYSDEILSFIRSEPIPGNCFFWSAPNQPFVLPVRVRNFEEAAAQTTPVRSTARFTEAQWLELVSHTVTAVLAGELRVWLYRVSLLDGRRLNGWLAFSREYLLASVAQRICEHPDFQRFGQSFEWLRAKLNDDVAMVIQNQKGRPGYAVMQGTTRQVWVLPVAAVELLSHKTLRSGSLEVSSQLAGMTPEAGGKNGASL